MAASADGKKQWATTDSQWEAYKDQIASLYCKQGKTLADVMEILAREHDFHATMKMYKYRLSRWGFRKYLSRTESRTIISKLASGQTVQLPIVQGRQLGSRQLKSQTHRANKVRKLIQGSGEPALPFMPLDYRVEPPDTLRALESALHSMRVYITGKMSYGQWPYTPDSAVGSWHEMNRATSWWEGLQSASLELERRRDSPAGFAQLSKAFEQFTSDPGMEEFAMVWCTYSAILRLSEIGDDLGQMFCKYVVNMACIKYGQYHPIAQRWAQISKFDASVRREAFASMMRLEVALVQDCSQPGSPAWMAIAAISLASACSQQRVTSDEGICHLSQASGGQPDTGVRTDTPLPDSLRLTSSAVALLISTYTSNNREISWGALPLELLLQVESSHSGQIKKIVDTLYVFVAFMDCIDTLGGAELYLQTVLDLLHRGLPDDHTRIAMAYSKLENLRQRQGNVEGAKAARLLYNHWRQSISKESLGAARIKDLPEEDEEKPKMEGQQEMKIRALKEL